MNWALSNVRLPEFYRYDETFLTKDPDAAIVRVRRRLRHMGWARTHVLAAERTPSATVHRPGAIDLHLVIEARGIRMYAADPSVDIIAGMMRFNQLGAWRRGDRVRTLGPGESFAHGRRAVKEAGAQGWVVGRDRWGTRVRFDGDPRSYGYAPRDLEAIKP